VPSPLRPRWLLPLGLLLLAGFLFFTRLGAVGLFDADEPAYAVAAREMRESGDWVTPTFNGQPRFDKPILFYYLLVVAYAAFGVNEFAVRAWPALAGVILTLVIYGLGRRHAPAACGTAALVFLLSPLTWVMGRAAVTDMVLTLCLTGCMAFLFALLAPEGEGAGRRHWLGAAACSALAVLVKGPLGLVLPGLVLVVHGLLTRRLGRALRRPGLLPAAALFCLLVLPWYLLVLRANGWAFVEGFLVKHHLQRYTGEVSGHGAPFWFFVPVLLVAFFPWSAFLPAALGRAFRRRGGAEAPGNGDAANEGREDGRTRHPHSVSRTPQWGAPDGATEWERFCAVWFVVTFLFFSGARTKLPSYLFPAFPALAFVVAGWFRDGGVSLRAWRWGTGLLGALGLALAAGAAAIPWILRAAAPRVPAIAEAPYTGWAHVALAGLFAAGTAAAAGTAWAGRRRAATAALAAMMGLAAATMIPGVLPWAHAYHEHGAAQSLVRGLRDRLGPDDAVILYGFNAPSVVFYAGRRVEKVERGRLEDLRRALASARPAYALARARDAGDFAGLPGVFLLAQRGGYGVYWNGLGP